jgi:hypothetical protein
LFKLELGLSRSGVSGGSPPASECLAVVFFDFGGNFDDLSPISWNISD